ncbi:MULTISPECIES: 1-acyl-sn-glycerol-3-phosphate acyltransferase [unclassified Diaminobutyricimonas]|uniref:lysophospholipid acyltransferase family protein n=2 Tax=unclassified Diaminobutyricimonas TaxID=2643261 RepID=UPI001E65378E|nr:lysophospholipid acyltransferase family protein [Diaminobutyricimonas sp. TR449]
MAKLPKLKSEKSFIWYVLAVLVLPLMNWLARYDIVDQHKMPRTGAFVLAPNHYSEIDPVVMGIAVWNSGRVPRFMAKASLFKIPVVRSLLKASGQIPVERAGSVRSSDPMAAARQLVDKELAVIIYPEGTLTRDPELWPMRGKTGAVRMALEAGIPLIPAAHWGTQHLMARYGKKISFWPPRKRIRIKFGDPVDLSAFEGRPLDSQTLSAATTVLMNEITKLLEDLRGEDAPAERWDPSKNNQKETGRFE